MADSESKSVPGARFLTRSREWALARLAAMQFGVVSLEQLLAIGFSLWEVRARVRRGMLHHVHRDVFAVGHARIVPHARLVAALLTCGPGSLLSHRTAAAVWGLRELTTRSIEITVPGSRALRRDGLVVHRSGLDPDPADVATRNGLRVSSVPRMLIEVAREESATELDRLITEAVRKRVLDLAASHRSRARAPRPPARSREPQACAARLPPAPRPQVGPRAGVRQAGCRH